MYEASALWRFTAPDGASITMNDTDTSQLGSKLFCEDVTGNDSPNVRENVEDRPEADGAIAGDFFYGSRPMTWSGALLGDPATRNQVAMQLQAATRGLRGDVVIETRSTGMPLMRATGRVQNLRITRREGIAKSFQLGIICPDPRFYSSAVASASGTGSVATSGFAFPGAFPLNFGGGSGATVTINVANAGNFSAEHVTRVTGPISDPNIKNATSGETLFLDSLTLAAGEWVELDSYQRTIVKNDGTNLYGKLRIPGSVWWDLKPGTNVIELRSTVVASTGVLLVTWRDSWA